MLCVISKEQTSFGVNIKLKWKESKSVRMKGMWLRRCVSVYMRMQKINTLLLLDMLEFSIWIQRKLFPSHPSISSCCWIHIYYTYIKHIVTIVYNSKSVLLLYIIVHFNLWSYSKFTRSYSLCTSKCFWVGISLQQSIVSRHKSFTQCQEREKYLARSKS